MFKPVKFYSAAESSPERGTRSKGRTMQTLGIIGSGNIGSAVARLAVASGMNVILANSRGPESLHELTQELGPLAKAGTVEETATDADAIVLSIPLLAVKELPAGLLRHKLVLDTSNYYPFRDGRISELDTEIMTTSELVHEWLTGARHVKAFNNILAHHIPALARDNGATDRSALPIASDEVDAKREAAAIMDRLGFDTLDAGMLADTWKFEPESAGYTRVYLADPSTPDDQLLSSEAGATSAAQLNVALANATRVKVADRLF
ncbi:NADPH-dependent F420 reductase [Arthrobacter alpinus]|uniref:NADPH-dependent F420 reductase n=1 Tax=Arthrobacter alpinus TaxID=656366 RepID=UPI0009FB193C|nr:NAD(P)-binding domain-containing protein [Arthrobacter alpinus]